MPTMLKFSVIAVSGTPIPVMSEEGPSAPMRRQATDVWVPLKEPARGIAAPVLQATARNTLVLMSQPRPSNPMEKRPRFLGSQHLREMPQSRAPNQQSMRPRGRGSPRLAATFEATGSAGGRGGPQAIREARPEKKQRIQADVVTKLYCFV